LELAHQLLPSSYLLNHFPGYQTEPYYLGR